MKLSLHTLLLFIAGLLLAATVAATLFVIIGVYNVSALRDHTAPVYALIERTMLHSIRRRAAALEVPDLSRQGTLDAGFGLYQERCEFCHGGPGVAAQDFALGMRPPPANMVVTAREWDAANVFWAVKHGIKMTGMPAWKYRLSDEEIWQVVAFVESMPLLTPRDYRLMKERSQAIAANAQDPSTLATPPANIDERDPVEIMSQYGCVTCHSVRAIPGANNRAGPPLDSMANRRFIAGFLANTPDNMQRWLLNPQQFKPDSAMPNLNLSVVDAAILTNYLLSEMEAQSNDP